MSTFFGLGLFDPSTSDEPVDLDSLCPSASALMDSRRPAAKKRASAGSGAMPQRSKTSVDLKSSNKENKDPIGTVRIRTRMASSHSEGDFSSLPPEPQQGNIEYKLKLISPTAQRLEHLVTQMKWRLREGQGAESNSCSDVYFLLFYLFSPVWSSFLRKNRATNKFPLQARPSTRSGWRTTASWLVCRKRIWSQAWTHCARWRGGWGPPSRCWERGLLPWRWAQEPSPKCWSER